MMLKELELSPGGELIVGQDALKEAGLEGRVQLIIQAGEIRIVPEAESRIDVDPFPADEQLLQIDREQQAYEAQHSQILKKYAGQYIAMRHGKVIDYDTDRVAISQRVRTRFGNEPVLITPVLSEARQTIVVRSPRLVENGL